MLHLDRGPEACTVHCEVRVRGRLDGERLAAAAQAANDRHPMARARLAEHRRCDARYFWEVPSRADRVPLQIVHCPDEASLADARSQLLSRRVDLRFSPPYALMLAHRPGGDTLIMNFNHVAADGISSHRLMTSICRAYAGVEDPVPDMDPIGFRAQRHDPPSSSAKGRTARIRRLAARISVGVDERPAVVSAPRTDFATVGFCFHLLRLGPNESGEALAHRLPSVSVNDLLLAATAVAVRRFNDERGVSPSHISIVMPVNLRPFDWRHEFISNIVALPQVSILPRNQTDLTSAQLAVAERTAILKQQHGPGSTVAVNGASRVFPVGVRRLTARAISGLTSERAPDTAVVSNLGVLETSLNFGGDAGPATELWFSPPGPRPLGLGIGVATLNSEMFVTIRSGATPDCVATFGNVLRDVLVGG